jgi:hypothetical protein
MTNWEFLLQKDGDRSWLPLDTPNVEILEGRYRIVARSHHPNADAEIRIVHLATEEDPPRRRVQKRTGHTNGDGLIVILPYTQFGPGVWTIQCASADPLAELMSASWQYNVQLHVLLRESEVEDWELDWSPRPHSIAVVAGPVDPAATRPTEPLGPVVPAAERMVEPATGEADRAIDAFLEDLIQSQSTSPISPELTDMAIGTPRTQAAPTVVESGSIESGTGDVGTGESVAVDTVPIDAAETDAASAAISTPLPHQPLAWSVVLDRSAFIVNREQGITISGYLVATPVEPSGAGARKPLDLSHIAPQALQICLRDPQTLQVLLSDSYSFTPATHHIPFSFTLNLPTVTATRLVLGEVLLCGSVEEYADDEIVLTSQAFTVTVDPNELVNEMTKIHKVLTNDAAEKGDLGDLPEAIATLIANAEANTVQLSFLNKPAPTPGTPTPITSLVGQPLPPQLFHPETPSTRTKAIELPDFSGTQRSPSVDTSPVPSTHATPPATANVDSPGAVEDASTVDAGAVAVEPHPDAVSDHSTDSQLDDDQRDLQFAPSSDCQPEAGSDPDADLSSAAIFTAGPELPVPIQRAFQSLRLQERFIARLSALAADRTLSAALQANPASLASEDSPTAALPPSTTSLTPDSVALHREVVVDDDPVEVAMATNRRRRDHRRHGIAPAPGTLPVEETETLPAPEVKIFSHELVAGEPVMVQVKLPDDVQPMQVKLWINDVQTRSLLEGPTWVTNFSPNGHGQMEASKQLTVPFGSTEIRFEAIAVELMTQRESRKAVCDRAVVPPGALALAIDDF